MPKSRAIKNKTAQWMILLVERKEPKQKKAQWIVPSASAEGILLQEMPMQLKILSNDFYDTYSHCQEILKKDNRPYVCLTIELNGILFAIPLRHHIKHKHAFHTIDDAGLDYTKAVVITDIKYLSADRPTIESKEFAILKKNEQKIQYGLRQYVHKYKKALKHRDNPRNANLLKYSSLQYFEKYL